MPIDRVEVPLGRHPLILETGKMAKQADGAVTVQYGSTVVLVTVCVAKEAKPEQDFLPLTCEYQEKTYAAGKIPGGFFKREGRPSEKEILSARLIDRPIRPLFPDGFFHEVQIVAIVLSHDGQNDPDVLAVLGASAACRIGGVPFQGPFGVLRVGRIDGQFVVNPTFEELDRSDLDLVVVAKRSGVLMVESGANEVSEQVILEAVQFARQQMEPLIDAQEKLAKFVGKPPIAYTVKVPDPSLVARVRGLALEDLKVANQKASKEEREEAVDAIAAKVVETLVTPEGTLTEKGVKNALVEVERVEVRRTILDRKVRIDGRRYDEIRTITCEVGVLPRTHGSGLFTRGQTQSLSLTTLGTSSDEQRIDALEGETFKNFMLHYSFPPFSVGEIKPIRGPGRREIGHGALAERALKPIMPSKDQFPYTVRVVSEILESNGSSSMATVCASTLSLMDAGVPIKAPVSGIAMGLVKEKDGVAILTDISGLEDHFGDMDFKVTGTQQGITAFQMDIKIDGVGEDILKDALEGARKARLFILEKIAQVLPAPRENISVYAPRITKIQIDPDKIREIIGAGGKVIRRIVEETKAQIDVDDDGTVLVASSDEKASARAIEIIKGIVEGPVVGQVYPGKVKRVTSFGAFCEILPGKEGLVHISELADSYVAKAEDVVKLGDEFPVKVIEIDTQGRINLSKKQALTPGIEKPRRREVPEGERRDRPPRR